MSAIEGLTSPASLEEFTQAGLILAELDSSIPILHEPGLRKVFRTRQYELFAEVTQFVEMNPELGEYYAGVMQAGEEAVGEDVFYEATLFDQLFPGQMPHNPPAAIEPVATEQSTSSGDILYINGKEFTRDEALILFTELLDAATEPLTAEALRKTDLRKFMADETGKPSLARFQKLRRLMKKSLMNTLGSVGYFIEEGPTRARRYSLVGELTLLKVVGTEVLEHPQELGTGPEEPSDLPPPTY